MTEPLLTVEEVAKRLKLNEWTVREWLKAGKIKGGKLGDTWRVQECDLQAFIDSSLKTETKE